MQQRQIGKSDISIAPIMLGGNVFGWTADEPTSFAVLDAFVAAGFNAIDTADVYSAWAPGHKGGESETVLGNWMAARKSRSQIVLATKVGMLPIGGKPGLSATQITEAAEGSLRRLKTDYIDIYFAHRDHEDTPLDETLEAFARLVRQGKVRMIGASNYSAPRLSQALQTASTRALPRYEILQPLYNLCDRAAFEGELAELCLREKIGVVPYYGLAAGFLTGKYRTQADVAKSPRGAGVVKKYLNPRGERILSALDQIAARLAATPAQVALAWLMAQPAVTAPIASASSPSQVEDLAAAATLKLDAQAQALLAEASAA
ncbi:MAG: aldo/keto reductase [Alphaproteobacteria bacterium]|nr:aldo/keto reductase [Alphaproteobacteria bacterium]